MSITDITVRAFALARSGRFNLLSEVREELRREGYALEALDALSGLDMRRRIKQLLKGEEPTAAPPAKRPRRIRRYVTE